QSFLEFLERQVELALLLELDRLAEQALLLELLVLPRLLEMPLLLFILAGIGSLHVEVRTIRIPLPPHVFDARFVLDSGQRPRVRQAPAGVAIVEDRVAEQVDVLALDLDVERSELDELRGAVGVGRDHAAARGLGGRIALRAEARALDRNRVAADLGGLAKALGLGLAAGDVRQVSRDRGRRRARHLAHVGHRRSGNGVAPGGHRGLGWVDADAGHADLSVQAWGRSSKTALRRPFIELPQASASGPAAWFRAQARAASTHESAPLAAPMSPH